MDNRSFVSDTVTTLQLEKRLNRLKLNSGKPRT
ncbi:hypothetical protein CsSME_00024649 [Camellia sinensis var. sinensis]